VHLQLNCSIEGNLSTESNLENHRVLPDLIHQLTFEELDVAGFMPSLTADMHFCDFGIARSAGVKTKQTDTCLTAFFPGHAG